MRRTTLGPTNRIGLAVLGLPMLAAGLAGLAVGSGLLHRLGPIGPRFPSADSTVLQLGPPADWLADGSSVALFGLVSLIVAALGLGWLLLQLPRVDFGTRFQLHDDARAGAVRCEAKVIAAAMADRLRQLPGVTDAEVTVGGTADHPTVRVDAEIDARADVSTVVAAVSGRAVDDVGLALERPVDELAMAVSIGQPKSSPRYVLVQDTGYGVQQLQTR